MDIKQGVENGERYLRGISRTIQILLIFILSEMLLILGLFLLFSFFNQQSLADWFWIIGFLGFVLIAFFCIKFYVQGIQLTWKKIKWDLALIESSMLVLIFFGLIFLSLSLTLTS